MALSDVMKEMLRKWLGIEGLENRMGKTEDALAELDAATNEVAAEIDELRASVENFDTATAQRLGAVSTRLRGLAADPENPVPDEPAPGDGEVVTEPAPGDGESPVNPDAPQA